MAKKSKSNILALLIFIGLLSLILATMVTLEDTEEEDTDVIEDDEEEEEAPKQKKKKTQQRVKTSGDQKTDKEKDVTKQIEAALEVEVFKTGTQKTTGYNDDGGGNAIYLDRHSLDCESNGISHFKLYRNPNNLSQYQYGYTCSTGGPKLGPSMAKNTGFNDDGGGNVVYLDRHNVDCGSDGVLSQFKLARNLPSQYRYDYKCLPSTKPLTCRNVSTVGNEDGKGNSVYLDRHDVKCNEDEVLNQFKLYRPTGNQINYEYKCCK